MKIYAHFIIDKMLFCGSRGDNFSRQTRILMGFGAKVGRLSSTKEETPVGCPVFIHFVCGSA